MNYILAAKFLFIILLLPGIAGAILPILPGLVYMIFIALLYAALFSFKILTLGELSILGGLTILSIIVDFLSGIIGGKIGGTSKKGLLWGLVGLVLGLLAFPPFGAFVGLFLGVFLGEYQIHRNIPIAKRAATYSFMGKTLGMGVNFILAIIFFILTIIFIF